MPPSVLEQRETSPQRREPGQRFRMALLLRRCHMYLGLFLTPWLIMYALSTVIFNHWGHINQFYQGRMEQFEPEKEVAYTKPFPVGASLREEGEQILKDLNLSGSFGVQNRDGKLVIDRHDPVWRRRITYIPDQRKLVIEHQMFRAATFLTTLHSQVGYENKLGRIRTWAATVDLMTIATFLLVITGIWMWWELKATRHWGTFSLLFGIALFAIFLRFA